VSGARAELEAAIRHLASFPRPSASDGERRAAEWIAERLRDEGCHARVEAERAHGTYWWPLGLVNGAVALAALGAMRHPRSRARRLLAAALGAAGAAAVWDDIGGGRQWFRRPLQAGATYNVVAEAGDPGAARTAVLLAHHDAAHGGAVFSPKIPRWVYDRRPDLFETNDRHLPIMYGVFLGPVLAALGALTGRRGPLAAAAMFGAGTAAAMTDIGRSPVSPGANDNLSAVAALLFVARRLREEPVRGLRVLLVSTGSEESFMEGMQGFVARHRDALRPDRTEMLCLESIGSPDAVVIEGEGMLRMRMYPAPAREALAAAADEVGVPVLRNLKTVLATDALIALRAGYRVVTLASVNEVKLPANYHSAHDTPDNLDWKTLLGCARVTERWVRRTAATG
jgi:Peptidase family M28